jgi:signal transduction histidine kinase/CheY-like chemotaxis protein
MHKLLQRQLRQARKVGDSGDVDWDALLGLIDTAYGEVDRERRYTAHSHQVMREEQASLVKQQAEAVAANQAKSRFLAMMSHEIRTPMNAVLALTQTLLDEKLEPKINKSIETIRDSGNNLLRILNDILDYSKLEAGQLTLENLAFSPAGVTQNIASTLEPRATTKGLRLTCTGDEDLPPALLGDAGRIRQVLLNLAANAMKFTATGSVTVETHCTKRSADEARIVWVVRDTGIGIAAEKITALFQEFTQADNSITRRFGGTGLGLAISKRIIDQMGGTITVDSVEGQGTSFRFEVSFPITDATPAESQDESDIPQRLKAALQQLGRPLRIMVAEDNATNQFIVTQLLKHLDIRVDVAANGCEAVALVKSASFDMILMDMQMPEMDGLEATRAIRQMGGKFATIPIIALTANAFAEDVVACREAGMDDFVAKPINKNTLLSKILAATGRRDTVASPSVAPLDAEPASTSMM